MKKLRIRVVVAVVPAVINLSACEWIKSGLPDKERDYYISHEIPTLQLPQDLKNQAIEFQPAPALLPGAPDPASSSDSQSKSEESSVDDLVKLVVYDGGATRIRIDESLDKSWRIVGKAISRNSIEITGRNQAESIYFVQFDPDDHEYDDGSLWDEATFFFGDDQHQEKDYHVRLLENKQLTEVIVTDVDDTPLSEGPGLILLNLLYETITADLQDKNN